jgi:hypothetical protein
MEDVEKKIENKPEMLKLPQILAVLFGVMDLILLMVLMRTISENTVLRRFSEDSQRQLDAISKQVSTRPSESKSKVGNKILKEVELKGFKIRAEDFSGSDETALSEYVSISVVGGGVNMPLLVNVNLMYGGDSFMQSVGEKLWVMNSQNRTIDIYNLETDENKTYGYLKYEKSVVMPQDVPGGFQSFSCSGTKCAISFAKNPESGCDLDYEIASGKFSKMKCFAMTGEFEPPQTAR